MLMDPRTYRRRRTLWLTVTAALAALLILGALQADLSAPEKAFGCLFYGGVSIAVGAQVLRATNPDAHYWHPKPFDAFYQDRHLRGVAFPLRAPNSVRWFGAAVVGAGLLGGGVFIGYTGTGVEGGTVNRIIATVLCCLFGLILLLGGLAKMHAGATPSTDWLVLARDGLHIPASMSGGTVGWDEIDHLDRQVRPANVSRIGELGEAVQSDARRRISAQYLRENDCIDVMGDQRQLARIGITQVPHPEQLISALEETRQDPSRQTHLDDPNPDQRLQPFSELATGFDPDGCSPAPSAE